MTGKLRRMVGGKMFTFKGSRATKAKAIILARNLRKKGLKARVMKVPQYKGHSVFIRRG